MSLTVQAPGSAINGYAAGNVEENKKGVSEKGTVSPEISGREQQAVQLMKSVRMQGIRQ